MRHVRQHRQIVESLVVFLLFYTLCVLYYAPYWMNAYPLIDEYNIVIRGHVFNLYDWFRIDSNYTNLDYEEWGVGSTIHIRPMYFFVAWLNHQVSALLDPYWTAYRLSFFLIGYLGIAGSATLVYHCARSLYGHRRMTAIMLALALVLSGAYANQQVASYAYSGLDTFIVLLFGLCLYALVHRRIFAVAFFSVLISLTKEVALPGLVVLSALCLVLPNWRRFSPVLALGPVIWYVLRLTAVTFSEPNVALGNAEIFAYEKRIFANIPLYYAESYYRIVGDRFHAYDFVVLANALFVLLWAYALWVIVRRIRDASDIRVLIDAWTGTPAAMLRSLLVILTGMYYLLILVFHIKGLSYPRYFAVPMLVMFLGLAAYVPRVFVRFAIPVILIACILASATVVHLNVYRGNILFLYRAAENLEQVIRSVNSKKPGRKIYIINDIVWGLGSGKQYGQYLNAPGLRHLTNTMYTLGANIVTQPHVQDIRWMEDRLVVRLEHPDIVIPLLNGQAASIARSLSEDGKRISVQNIRYDFDRVDVEKDKNGVGRVVGYGKKVTYHILNPPSGTALIIWNYEKLRWEVHE